MRTPCFSRLGYRHGHEYSVGPSAKLLESPKAKPQKWASSSAQRVIWGRGRGEIRSPSSGWLTEILLWLGDGGVRGLHLQRRVSHRPPVAAARCLPWLHQTVLVGVLHWKRERREDGTRKSVGLKLTVNLANSFLLPQKKKIIIL